MKFPFLPTTGSKNYHNHSSLRMNNGLFFIVPPASGKIFLKGWMALASGGANAIQTQVYSFEPAGNEDDKMVLALNHDLAMDSNEFTFYQAKEANQVVIRGTSSDQPKLLPNISGSGQVSPQWLIYDGGANGIKKERSENKGVEIIPHTGGHKKDRIRFYTFYHPYICLFLKHLTRYGIDGLLNSNPIDKETRTLFNQLTPDHLDSFDFWDDYRPNPVEVDSSQFPQEIITFNYEDPYATYNWELFFHVPLLIATQLSEDQPIWGGAALVSLYLQSDRSCGGGAPAVLED